jgi:hypothetical protein
LEEFPLCCVFIAAERNVTMYLLPTVPNPGSNPYNQHQSQQVPPSPSPSPHHPTGPYDIGNWELRWRRRTTYDAKGRLTGTAVEEEAIYTPPHLRHLQPSQMQRGRQGLLWLLLFFLLAPLVFPLVIVGLMLLGVVVSVLQPLLLSMGLVVIGLLVLLLLFRLLRTTCSRP